jgi:chromosome segregation ATPase
MKPDPTEPSDLVIRLRQQLILAQVRIMELEDARDSLAPQLAELEQLLAAAQNLADQKLDEAAHLEKILAEARAQAEQLRQAQQQTGAELAEARTALARHHDTVAQLETTLRAAESEVQDMKSSRRWRWSAWLR